MAYLWLKAMLQVNFYTCVMLSIVYLQKATVLLKRNAALTCKSQFACD